MENLLLIRNIFEFGQKVDILNFYNSELQLITKTKKFEKGQKVVKNLLPSSTHTKSGNKIVFSSFLRQKTGKNGVKKCKGMLGRRKKMKPQQIYQQSIFFSVRRIKVSARCKASIYIDALHLALTCRCMIFNKIKNLFF